MCLVAGLQYELQEQANNRLFSVQPAYAGCAWQGPLSAATAAATAATAMSTVGAGAPAEATAGADGAAAPGTPATPDTPGGAPAAPSATPAAPKPRPVRRGVKPPPDRPQRALFFLYLKNPVRKLCIDIVEWKYPFSSTSSGFF